MSSDDETILCQACRLETDPKDCAYVRMQVALRMMNVPICLVCARIPEAQNLMATGELSNGQLGRLILQAIRVVKDVRRARPE